MFIGRVSHVLLEALISWRVNVSHTPGGDTESTQGIHPAGNQPRWEESQTVGKWVHQKCWLEHLRVGLASDPELFWFVTSGHTWKRHSSPPSRPLFLSRSTETVRNFCFVYCYFVKALFSFFNNIFVLHILSGHMFSPGGVTHLPTPQPYRRKYVILRSKLSAKRQTCPGKKGVI